MSPLLTPEIADRIGSGLVSLVFIVIAAKVVVPLHRQNEWRNTIDSWLHRAPRRDTSVG
jgi:hypothetical protein